MVITLDGIKATFHARSMKCAHYIFFTNSYNFQMANNRRNNELTEAVQAIRDMATTLLRNQRPEGNLESQGLAEFRRNKPSQFFEEYDPEKVELLIKEMEKIF